MAAASIVCLRKGARTRPATPTSPGGEDTMKPTSSRAEQKSQPGRAGRGHPATPAPAAGKPGTAKGNGKKHCCKRKREKEKTTAAPPQNHGPGEARARRNKNNRE